MENKQKTILQASECMNEALLEVLKEIENLSSTTRTKVRDALKVWHKLKYGG